jgi:hypothetical protein
MPATVKGVKRRDETIVRLGGNGDNWHMSWAGDDSQVVSLCDGSGWPGTRRQLYNSRLYRILGSPPEVRFEDVPGYPDLLSESDKPGGFSRYYCFGTLALDGSIYQFLSTPNVPFDQPDPRFVGAKLIFSPDGGVTWCNQDGTAPVVWEPWDTRSRENMLFFEESQEAFQLLTVVQMGKNYEHNSDGYVYVCSPNGNSDGTMNELVMFRVESDRILDRDAYEYFAGSQNGNASWTHDIDGRAVVHTFPPGWVNTKVHPYAWQPSITYNEPLGVYLMANWGMGCAPDGMWFGKPSYLGFWAAPDPWGPWDQIHEETAWTPGGDSRARVYQPQIAPKWIAPDGKSFWLVWTDFQSTAESADFEEAWQRIQAEASSQDELFDRLSALMPYYAFNAQRVDLDVN